MRLISTSARLLMLLRFGLRSTSLKSSFTSWITFGILEGEALDVYVALRIMYKSKTINSTVETVNRGYPLVPEETYPISDPNL